MPSPLIVYQNTSVVSRHLLLLNGNLKHFYFLRLILATFLAHDKRQHERAISYRSSVYLSVRPSVTRVDQSKTVEVRIMQFSPTVAPSLYFLRDKFHPEILTGPPEWGRQSRMGWGKQAIF